MKVSYSFHISLLLLFTGCIAVQFNYDKIAGDILKADGGQRISGIQDRTNKDIVLGGLFTIYYETGTGSAQNGQCGSFIWKDGIDMMEAMLYAIDTINGDPNLLPNITLGYDIRDTCKRVNVALDEAVDMILSNGDLNSCRINSSLTPVSVIHGTYESYIAIPLATLLRLFKKPQISFGSSSTELSNRELYSYFYRTFPPDDQQAQAMIDLILHFGWDHISTINSNNLYGQRGIEEVHKNAREMGICIDLNEIITDEFSIADYRELAEKLMNSSSNVVVLFASFHHIHSFLQQLSRLQTQLQNDRQFLWIVGDTWSEVIDEEFNNITAGKYGFAVYSENLNSFDNYYTELTPNTNKRNPWFPAFYEQYYNCILNDTCDNVSRANYRQHSTVPLVVDAIYSAAHAVHNFIEDNCPKPLVWYPFNQSCLGYNQSLNGDTLFEYISRVNFTSPSKNRVKFNSFGNVIARYSLLNLQVSSSCQQCKKEYNLIPVAYWDGSVSNNRLQFYPNVSQQFGINQTSGNVLLSFRSQCQECTRGFIKRTVTSSCCGTCDPCLGSNYTNSTSSTQCTVCPEYMWGNTPLIGSTECVHIEESYLKVTDPWSIVLIILAVIGSLAVAFVVVVFIWFWNTPIVKSSGREQMILLLIGLILCFLITIVFILKPSPAVCGLQRIGLWFSYSLILCALFIKLVRIARIFLQKDISRRPKFITSGYQILFTFVLVCLQMILVVISLSVVPPDVTQTLRRNEDNSNNFPVLIVQCTTPHIVMIILQMIYYSALIITSNALAILTIRFPANFNESKYVAFSTFSLTLMWVVFVPSYVVTSNTIIQPAVTSFTVQMSALVVLVCLFGPRSFIMIFWPRLNVQTTTFTGKKRGSDFPKSDDDTYKVQSTDFTHDN